MIDPDPRRRHAGPDSRDRRATLHWLALALMIFMATPGLVAARPAESILGFLQPGSREDLGLGGDPFLSVAKRESGWWQHGLLDSSSTLRFDTDQYHPLTQRLSGNSSEILRTHNRLGIQQFWCFRARTLQLGLTAASGRVSTTVEQDLSTLGLLETGLSYAAILRLRSILPGLDAQCAFPLGRSGSSQTKSELRGGLHWTLGDRVWSFADWLRWESNEIVSAKLDDEIVESPLNLKLAETNVGSRVRFWQTFCIELVLRQTSYKQRDELSGIKGSEFIPQASSRLHHWSFEWGAPGGLRCLLRTTEIEFRGAGKAYWNGERYTRLSHGRMDLNTWLLGMQIPLSDVRRLVFDLEVGIFEGFGRVDVDSWRFVSWQEAWLGAKKIIQLDGKARWNRYHLGYEGPWGSRLLKGGLSWYDLYPEAWSESWVHVPLMPKQYYVKTDLARSRISLGAVSLGFEGQWGPIDVSASVHQFVHYDDHLDVSGQAPPDEPGEGKGPSGWFGGTFAQFSLGHAF